MGWKPISTAPKDGSLIDIWCYNDERWTDCYWHRDLDCWATAFAGPGGKRGHTVLFGQPTHWMPIPERPA